MQRFFPATDVSLLTTLFVLQHLGLFYLSFAARYSVQGLATEALPPDSSPPSPSQAQRAPSRDCVRKFGLRSLFLSLTHPHDPPEFLFGRSATTLGRDRSRSRTGTLVVSRMESSLTTL